MSRHQVGGSSPLKMARAPSCESPLRRAGPEVCAAALPDADPEDPRRSTFPVTVGLNAQQAVPSSTQKAMGPVRARLAVWLTLGMGRTVGRETGGRIRTRASSCGRQRRARTDSACGSWPAPAALRGREGDVTTAVFARPVRWPTRSARMRGGWTRPSATTGDLLVRMCPDADLADNS